MNGDTNLDTKNVSKPLEHEDDHGWHLVGTFKTTTADIKNYYVVPPNINIDNCVS